MDLGRERGILETQVGTSQQNTHTHAGEMGLPLEWGRTPRSLKAGRLRSRPQEQRSMEKERLQQKGVNEAPSGGRAKWFPGLTEEVLRHKIVPIS